MSSTTSQDSSQPAPSEKSSSPKKSKSESEPRFSKLTEEQQTRIFRHLAEIQKHEKDAGLQQTGPEAE